MIFSTAEGYGAAYALPGACERRARKKRGRLGRREAFYRLSSFRCSSSGSLAMAAMRRGILLGQPLRFEGMI